MQSVGVAYCALWLVNPGDDTDIAQGKSVHTIGMSLATVSEIKLPISLIDISLPAAHT